ncbi:apg9-domain-containing protein [Phaffia rhodozyma]|uniref:Autophagy-related protein 9 n=1 Tax=Phaffia rhodozyma TaxID=264483 RepID=A0A0F7SX76_PHARH|nr:apg9-domain-containing protein [Phaffia rhodozyma]
MSGPHEKLLRHEPSSPSSPFIEESVQEDTSFDQEPDSAVPQSFLIEQPSRPVNRQPAPASTLLPPGPPFGGVETVKAESITPLTFTNAPSIPRVKPVEAVLPFPVTTPLTHHHAHSRPRPGSPSSTTSSSSSTISASTSSASSSPRSSFSRSPSSSTRLRRIHQSSSHGHSDNHQRNASLLSPKLDAYEKALWDWVNVDDLDLFLQDVYEYYKGNGIFCIVLSRALNLITVGFVVGFSTFLLRCVDFSLLRAREGEVTSLEQVIVPQCIARSSGITLLGFVLFGAFYIWQIVMFALSIKNLRVLSRFYSHLLKIPDTDIQTVSWAEVVTRIGQIRESNPITSLSSSVRRTTTGMSSDSSPLKLDAHDIANRILRQENYLVALFNKDLLDLSVPGVPSIFGGNKQVLTRALVWNLRFCLLGYLCSPRNEGGGVRKVFLKERNKTALVEGLRQRFIFMGIINALFAPFIVLYLLFYSFFRYFEEYHKNPSSAGGRTYTPLAQWKFREYNELPHLFERRLNASHPIAKKYIDQFPKEKTTIVMRFLSFIAGAFASVLVLASILDPDLVLHFEITPHRTVLFYITVFGSILAITRGMIPEEGHVAEPEVLLDGIVHYTHYLPDEWKGKLHSRQVLEEFTQLFDMKIAVFARELLSVLLTPLILWVSLPNCAPAIIDFFREFTVQVDGVGYVCSFAVFDFERHGNAKYGAPTDAPHARFQSEDGKMEKSFLNFKASHPTWNPTDPTASMFLSRLSTIDPFPRPDRSPHLVPSLPPSPSLSPSRVNTTVLSPPTALHLGLPSTKHPSLSVHFGPSSHPNRPSSSSSALRPPRSSNTRDRSRTSRIEEREEDTDHLDMDSEGPESIGLKGWDDVSKDRTKTRLGRTGRKYGQGQDNEREGEQEGDEGTHPRLPDGDVLSLLSNIYATARLGR